LKVYLAYFLNYFKDFFSNCIIFLGKQWPNSFNRQTHSNNELGSNIRNENNLKENIHNDSKSSSLNILDSNELNPEESKNDNLGESDNQKENAKTPMCIINELVKFNKVKFCFF
jgi:hypothetical protein